VNVTIFLCNVTHHPLKEISLYQEEDRKMSITQQQTELVQTTFAKVVPIAAQAADMFYARLFEIAPHMQPLFKATNMKV
jgi:hypothetical protein